MAEEEQMAALPHPQSSQGEWAALPTRRAAFGRRQLGHSERGSDSKTQRVSHHHPDSTCAVHRSHRAVQSQKVRQ